jgi:transcriptional regulator with XRE-family HTH domain
MTGDELRTTIAALGWTSRELARQLGVSKSRAQRWYVGDAPIPEPVARWLGKLARAHAALPAPSIADTDKAAPRC